MPTGPRIALLGAFDVEDAVHLLTPRVIEAELRRRLPEASVTTLAPLGRLRPLALDGGRAAEPLGSASAGTRRRLAGDFDCLLVCGDDTLVTPERAATLWGGAGDAAGLLVDGPGEELEATCPMVWAGVSLGDDPDPSLSHRLGAAAVRRGPIAVLDGGSRRRLAAVAPKVEVLVLPPWTLLIPRLHSAPALDARAELLRLLEWAWPPGSVLTVHGDRTLLGDVDGIAAALVPLVESGAAAVQLAAPGRLHGEDEFAGALESALDGRCRRLPAEAQLEDQVAVLRGSAAFLGPPGFGLWAAQALGTPTATPEATLRDGATGLRRLLDPGTPPPGPPREPEARLDGYLDRLAGIALVSAARRATLPAAQTPPAALLLAHRALGRRLFAERLAFQSAYEAELHQARAEAERLGAELGAARAANDAIVGSRTWRYSQPVRDGLARVRERRR